MDTKDRGDLSERKVVVRLMELGYIVSTPESESCRYDIIADDGNNLHRLQVKTGRLEDNTIVFNTCDIRSNRTGNTRKQYSASEIDAFLVYNPKLDVFCWVDVSDTPSAEMTIRISESDSKFATYNRSNWLEDYQIPVAR